MQVLSIVAAYDRSKQKSCVCVCVCVCVRARARAVTVELVAGAFQSHIVMSQTHHCKQLIAIGMFCYSLCSDS